MMIIFSQELKHIWTHLPHNPRDLALPTPKKCTLIKLVHSACLIVLELNEDNTNNTTEIPKTFHLHILAYQDD
jgi:hypothetical protein